jgi:hypothetical protein
MEHIWEWVNTPNDNGRIYYEATGATGDRYRIYQCAYSDGIYQPFKLVKGPEGIGQPCPTRVASGGWDEVVANIAALDAGTLETERVQWHTFRKPKQPKQKRSRRMATEQIPESGQTTLVQERSERPASDAKQDPLHVTISVSRMFMTHYLAVPRPQNGGVALAGTGQRCKVTVTNKTLAELIRVAEALVAERPTLKGDARKVSGAAAKTLAALQQQIPDLQDRIAHL